MIQAIEIPSLPGHADAHADLLLGGAAQDVRHLEVGVCFDPQPGEQDSYTSDEMALIDAGSSTEAGSIGANVAKMVVGPEAAQVCEVQAMPHVGIKRIRLRAQSDEVAFVRLAWRLAGGPFIYEPWVELQPGSWQFPLIAAVKIPRLPVGHAWTARIEARSPDSAEVSVDVFAPLAADRWTLMRASQSESVGLIAHDDFDGHASGNLAGKTAPAGGDWAGSGGSSNLQVDAGDGVVERSASVADASNRLETLDDVDEYDVAVSSLIACTSLGLEGTAQIGLLARYEDPNNYVVLWLYLTLIGGWIAWVEVYDGGTPTQLTPSTSAGSLTLNATPSNMASIRFDLAGSAWRVRANGLQWIAGDDPEIAAAGSGRVGLAALTVDTESAVFSFDRFEARAVEPSAVLYAGRELRVTHEAVLREIASGGVWGQLPSVMGRYLTLPPGRPLRLVISASVDDIDAGGGHTVLADPLDVELSATPRVTLLGVEL